MTILSGKAMLAGVLGYPVAHSRSPRLHGLWLQRYGVDGAYLPLPVPPEHFATAVRGLVALGFRGANVTIPHKQAAFEICDEVDPTARRMGAVNTLRFVEGRILGSNTDGFGFLENIRASVPGWHGVDLDVLVAQDDLLGGKLLGTVAVHVDGVQDPLGEIGAVGGWQLGYQEVQEDRQALPFVLVVRQDRAQEVVRAHKGLGTSLELDLTLFVELLVLRHAAVERRVNLSTGFAE
jgi:hypothetical protein